MALNKDILGTALYNTLDAFNDKDIDETGDIEAARLAFCKALANEVINHIKSSGVVNVTVTTTGTAAAHTGTGVGAIT